MINNTTKNILLSFFCGYLIIDLVTLYLNKPIGIKLFIENIKSSNVAYCKKIIVPTSKEIQLHSEYLVSNLKKNNFN